MKIFEQLEYSHRGTRGCNPLLLAQVSMRVTDVHAIALMSTCLGLQKYVINALSWIQKLFAQFY